MNSNLNASNIWLYSDPAHTHNRSVHRSLQYHNTQNSSNCFTNMSIDGWNGIYVVRQCLIALHAHRYKIFLWLVVEEVATGVCIHIATSIRISLN